MPTRQNYKLRPNKSQSDLMAAWVVELRKHRNYALRERINGYQTNNLHNDSAVAYAVGSFCDIETKNEYGAMCPLACAVVKHGVAPDGIELTKKSKGKIVWNSASGIQQKATTKLRGVSEKFGAISSTVLQQNIAKLDKAFVGFWKHERGYPAFRTRANFKSVQYSPGKVLFDGNRVYIPGIGLMRYHNSRPFPADANIGTVTVICEADGWYLSVLIKNSEPLPEQTPIEELKSNVSIDVGINKLASLTDGSHIENPRIATNKRMKRRMRIRQRRVNRKLKGSNNRAKAGIEVAKLHKKIRDKRDSHQWQAAKKIVDTADSIGHEALKIKNMKKRCKPNKHQGRFLPNGQSAKRGLNRAISDAAWGGLFDKIAWLAAKSGKPVFKYAPHYTSQECSKCAHTSSNNRDGEKFVCENCGHVDHADTQAARNGQKRLNLNFVSTRRKKPTRGLRESNARASNDSAQCRVDPAPRSQRDRAGNRTIKHPIEPSTPRIAETRILDDIA